MSTAVGAPLRWATAEIDLGAVRHNVGVLRAAVAPSALWAVVKANAYGHGAVAVARAALEAGAAGLCVALTQEAVELRDAGIDAPILLLSQQPDADAHAIVGHSLIPTVYDIGAVDALVAAGAAGLSVHVKVDTGMGRVGLDPSRAASFVRAVVARSPAVVLGGVFTHLAVADEPQREGTGVQLDRFDAVLDEIRPVATDGLLVHAANSAAALAHPRSRFSMVRAGIALYGICPGPGVADLCGDLRPAMRWTARVSFVKRIAAGSAISYGWRHTFDGATTVATVPLGYADGVARRSFETGCEVLVGGRRRPIVGVVTMDQLMVDMGDDPVAVGDEVVLIGRQGDELLRAEDWAARLGTIGYEIACAVGQRVPRVLRSSIDS